ncbi:MAG: hypothetical protein FWE01_01320 [Firmicutes bacterium]|nr:hypothetical protein [Bacillota bacterium]
MKKKFILVVLGLILLTGAGIAIYFAVSGGPGRNTLRYGNPYILYQMRHNMFFDSGGNELNMQLDGARNSFAVFDENFTSLTFNFATLASPINHTVNFVITNSRLNGTTFRATMNAIIGGELVWFNLRTSADLITIRTSPSQTVVNEGEVHNSRNDSVIALVFRRSYYSGGNG